MKLTLDPNPFRRALGFALCAAIYWTWSNLSESHPALSILFFTTLVMILLILEVFLQSEQPFRNVAFFVLGVFYIIIPFALLND